MPIRDLALPARPSKPSATKASLAAIITAMIAGTVALEGGYVNHPSDPGGETKNGITKRVAVAHGYTGPMRKLPAEVRDGIYYESYIVRPGYLPLVSIDAAVTTELFDTAVNMGPEKSSRFLQASLNEYCGTGLGVDGRVGPKTVAAFRSCQQAKGTVTFCRTMLDRLDAKQRGEYDRLVRASARYRVFYRGWIAHRIGNVDRRACTVPA